jgi:hypothetical protein
LAWSAIDAEPYCEEPVHHDRKRVHKLVNIIAGVPVALTVGTAIFTMQHQTAAPSSAPSTPTVIARPSTTASTPTTTVAPDHHQP